MKAFVTGATGFIGSHLVERLRSEGAGVKALVLPTSESAFLSSLGAEIVVGDLLDPKSVRTAADGCDVAFHLGAALLRKTSERKMFHAVNVLGTHHVMQAAVEAGVGRLVHCSTGGVHGPSWSIIDEDSPLRPDNPYRATRLDAERVVADHYRKHGLPVVVARLSEVYGPRDQSRVQLFREAAHGRINLPGGGGQTIHLSYVDDVVEGLVRCARAGGAVGRTYLIGTDRPPSLWEFIKAIADEAGATNRRRPWMNPPLKALTAFSDAFTRPLGTRPAALRKLEFFTRPRRYDVSRAMRELGLPPGVPLREGVRQTLAWCRSQGFV